MMNLNLTVTEADYEMARELPRKMSASRILRSLLTALRTTDAEWKALLKADSELRETKEWVRINVISKFGL